MDQQGLDTMCYVILNDINVPIMVVDGNQINGDPKKLSEEKALEIGGSVVCVPHRFAKSGEIGSRFILLERLSG